MKLTILAFALASLFASFIVLAGNVSGQPSDTLMPSLCGSMKHESIVNHDDQGVDLGTCERGCRRRFGYEPTMSDEDHGLLQNGPYYAYAQCIADCNNAFWKDFERRTRGMSEGR